MKISGLFSLRHIPHLNVLLLIGWNTEFESVLLLRCREQTLSLVMGCNIFPELEKQKNQNFYYYPFYYFFGQYYYFGLFVKIITLS